MSEVMNVGVMNVGQSKKSNFPKNTGKNDTDQRTDKAILGLRYRMHIGAKQG